MTRIHALSAASLIVAATCAGAETYDWQMTGLGTSDPNVLQLAEDLVVIDARTNYEGFEPADAEHPFASATGPCFGSILIKSGQVSGGGHCVYTDADDDMVAVSWTAHAMTPEGLTLGTWSIEGGTGKWADATGGGNFMGGGDGGEYSNEISGAVTIP